MESAMRGPNSFIEALLNCDFETARALLFAGTDVNAKYGEGRWSAMHFMAENRIAEAVAWLLEQGADINAQDMFGQTPLHLAIDSEADCARQEYDKTGVSSLSGEITKLLLEHGADMNAKTSKGRTPLAIARAMGHTVAVEELKRHGAQDE